MNYIFFVCVLLYFQIKPCYIYFNIKRTDKLFSLFGIFFFKKNIWHGSATVNLTLFKLPHFRLFVTINFIPLK